MSTILTPIVKGGVLMFQEALILMAPLCKFRKYRWIYTLDWY